MKTFLLKLITFKNKQAYMYEFVKRKKINKLKQITLTI